MAEPNGDIFGPIDAETDDLTQFTGTLVHASNALTAAEDASFILHGDHSFKIVFGGTSGYVCGYKQISSTTLIYARMYFKIDTLTIADDSSVALFELRDTIYGSTVCSFKIYGTGTAGQYGYIFATWDDVGYGLRVNHRDGNIFQDDTLYYVEIYWKQGAGDGVENIWIDGVDAGGRTSVDNNTYAITYAYMGATDRGETPTAGTIYFDDCKGNTTSIGAYPAAAGGSIVPRAMHHYKMQRRGF